MSRCDGRRGAVSSNEARETLSLNLSDVGTPSRGGWNYEANATGDVYDRQARLSSRNDGRLPHVFGTYA